MVRIDPISLRSREMNLRSVNNNTTQNIDFHYPPINSGITEGNGDDHKKAIARMFLETCSGVSAKSKEYLLNDEKFLNNVLNYANNLENDTEARQLERTLVSYANTIQNWKDNTTITMEHSINTFGYENDIHEYQSIVLTKVTLTNGQKAYMAEDGTYYGLGDDGGVDFNTKLEPDRMPMTDKTDNTRKQANEDFATDMADPNNWTEIVAEEPVEAPVVEQNPVRKPNNAGTTSSPGITLTYEINDDGRPIIKQGYVDYSENPDFDFFKHAEFTEDNDGYHCRGLTSRNISSLLTLVQQRAMVFARETAIYNDLKAKGTLTAGEEKFVENYLKSLESYGIRINENGELENIEE